jgi:hypothetical protein
MWAGAEALIWWEKRQPLPADLVSSGALADHRPGALGQPGTATADPALDPSNEGYGAFVGLRLFAGTWLDPQQVMGLEASGLVLENRGHIFGITSNAYGLPLLALRHLDPAGAPGNIFLPPAPSVQGGTVRPSTASTQDAFVVAAPAASAKMNPFTGGIVIRSDSQLWGTGGNILHALAWSPDFHLVALVGMRYFDLNESVAIQTQTVATGGSQLAFLGGRFPQTAIDGKNTPQVAAALTADSFHARDRFYGGQLGLRGEYFFDRFFVRGGCILDLGETDEVQNILGNSSLQPKKKAALITTPGGLYALPTNSGQFGSTNFSVIPEVQVQGGVLLTPWLRATIGYDLLYWTGVLRPGDQIDLNVDRRQVPTNPAFKAGTLANFPRPLANQSDYWLQGLTVGLDLTY